MSWWSTQPSEMKAAYVGAATAVLAASIGLLGPLIGESQASPAGDSRGSDDPAYCLDLLKDMDDFLDRDPRNAEVFLRTGPQGQPLVRFGADARECGINDPAVLRNLGKQDD